jgi:hypothetical protein
VTVLYKYWSVRCEATYLCLCLSSRRKCIQLCSLLHVQVCQCRGLCSHLQHTRSTLLQILEKDLFHIVKQQLLYKRYVNFTLVIAATCYSFIPISLFTFVYRFSFFQNLLCHLDKLRSVWWSAAYEQPIGDDGEIWIRTDVLQGLMWAIKACGIKDLSTDSQNWQLFSTIICQ